jgi:hypothetical protein
MNQEVMNENTAVYSINVRDLQQVALEKAGRRLTDAEIELVGEKVGDFIDWIDVIESAIDSCPEIRS